MGHHKAIKYSNFWCPKGKEKLKEVKNLFIKITVKNFPGLARDLEIQMQEAGEISKQIQLKKGLLHGTLQSNCQKSKTKGSLKTEKKKKIQSLTRERPSDSQQISQQKFYWPGKNEMLYSKSRKTKIVSQGYYTQQSYAS